MCGGQRRWRVCANGSEEASPGPDRVRAIPDAGTSDRVRPAIKLALPRFDREEARAGTMTTNLVAGIGQRAAGEREAAAADAPRQVVAQPDQLLDPAVELGPPARRQPRPVRAAGGRAETATPLRAANSPGC